MGTTNTPEMNFLHTRLRVLTKPGEPKTAEIQLLRTRLRVLKNLRENTPGKALPIATPANRRGVPRPDPRRDPTTEQAPAAPPRPATLPPDDHGAAPATGHDGLFSKRELQGAACLPVDVGGRVHLGVLLRGVVVALGTDASLVKIFCRDCGKPFDVSGSKRRQQREQDNCDPFSCYACRGLRRNAFFSERDAARAAGAGEAGAQAAGAAAAGSAGQHARSLNAAAPPWAVAPPPEGATTATPTGMPVVPSAAPDEGGLGASPVMEPATMTTTATPTGMPVVPSAAPDEGGLGTSPVMEPATITTTKKKKKKKKKTKTARTDPSPDPATSPPTPADPIADSSPVPSREPLPTPPSPIADPSPALPTPPSPIADPALLNPTSDAHIASGVDQLERIHTLLCTLRAETALALLEPNRVSDLFDDVAEDLLRCLLWTRASPDLCSSIGIDQPAWTEDDYTEQGGALLMALGINAPATVLAAIKCQCHMGAPFGYPPPETAPQQMRELHDALAALKPHKT